METKDIVEKLRDIMRSSSQVPVEWDKVGPESAIAEMGFDSLAVLDLIYDIQQGFGIEFDAEEMTQVKTVGGLAEFLQAKLAES